jgi:hypothetical protein
MRPICGICGGHITVSRFHLNNSVFPCQYHSTHIIHQHFLNILVNLLGDGIDDSGLKIPDRFLGANRPLSQCTPDIPSSGGKAT